MKEYKYKINGNDYAVKINKIENNQADVEVNGKSYSVELCREEKQAPKPVVRRVQPTTSTVSSAPKPAATSGAKGGIKSPLPGVILELSVAVGDEVKRGQRVAILEAMKMENNINSDRDGKVLEIKVQKGDSILEGTDILIIG
ncbi:acetyl-CoA carboxylase biotin carboxyl carrier protein [Porphyromonas circumdentaria]|uniref:Biotin-requiring enzyme n=1 Tax=Porphyromonas circumdentaria TaxID=29524 RepID=A0A1T4L1C5_9PORP|nr:biotin/lipoyl-containing protein [Porphyromonas circumdentaria]MBB6275182.1 biotin carboxyl carrier protein [Porphyromonas circumdentaria]MDO4721812.1 biotin/lipoyl-containing protein [Porphyromonas circumdentaria]SJZ48496.1 Biotin-requiring enzyme [Porphyromonas circumdentaria]